MTALVIGVGHPDRGDDGVGPAVAARLQTLGVDAVVVHGDCARLIDLWAGRDHVVVVDALRADDPPGTIRRFDARTEPLPAGAFRSSSHLFGLADAIALAQVLDRLPPDLVVYGVAGARFDLGAGLSPPVDMATDRIVKALESKSIAGSAPSALSPMAR